MSEENVEYINQFHLKLEKELLKIAQAAKLAGERYLESDDLDNRWVALANEYIGDAVMEINSYPTVAVAWAAFLGMAVAFQWDTDWEKYKSIPYQTYYGRQGFDDLDEHCLRDILGLALDSEEAQNLNALVRRMAETAVSAIHHEQIAPQSPTAFHIFARACTAMFRIGANMELARLGYKMERMG